MTHRKDEFGRPVVSVLPYGYGPTYTTQSAVTGPSGGGPSGSNKAMVSLLNPASSGKVAKIRVFSVQAETTSGSTVIIVYELRRITAHATGTDITPLPRNTTSAASVVQAKEEPGSVTGDTNIQSYIIQSNTAQGPSTYFATFGTVGEEPIVLNEGEGLVAHQVSSNGGIFRIGFVWTEEDIVA